MSPSAILTSGRGALPGCRWQIALLIWTTHDPGNYWHRGAGRPGSRVAIWSFLRQLSSGVQLIEVYATVTDSKGELVTGLRQSDFQVFENDRPQEISAFAAGEFPLTVALGVDRSFSMAGAPLRLAKLASQTFLLKIETHRPLDGYRDR